MISGMALGWGRRGKRERITFPKRGQSPDMHLQVNHLTIFYILSEISKEIITRKLVFNPFRNREIFHYVRQVDL